MERLAAVLLRVYPRAFRDAHGREVLQFVRAASQTEGAARVTFDLLADAARSIPSEWRDVLRHRRAPVHSHHGDPMRTLGRDIRYATRRLRKSPGFTFAAVLTLALAIGANTAIFSVAHATLLRPVQVAHPERVVAFSWSSSFPDYEEYAARADVFSGVVGVASRERVSLSIDSVSEIRAVSFVSGNAFDVLGVPPAIGRTLHESDDVREAPLVAVLSFDYWHARFGGRDDVLGRTIQANGKPVTIVGVAQRGFRGTSLLSTPHLFLPLRGIAQVDTGFFAQPRLFTSRGAVWITVLGRVKDGVTVAQATSAMDAQYRLQHPPRGTAEPERLRLVPLTTRALGSGADAVRRFVMLLLAVVAVTLVVGCANLANLLLARVAARRRELGVRLALGASRAAVVRQTLVETTVLAALGGVAGLVVAHVMLRALGAFELPGDIEIGSLSIGVDRTALVATATLSMATGLLFGAAPAWRASRLSLVESLGDGARGASAQGGIRSTLLAVQVALCLVLLTGSGLFLRSLVRVVSVPLGYQPSQVAVASVNLSLARFDAVRTRAYYDGVLERARSLPGVTAAAWSSGIPTLGGMTMMVRPEGSQPSQDDPEFDVKQVGPEYFSAAGTRILTGRAFAVSDNATATPVAVINEAAARAFFGGNETAIGRRLSVTARGPVATIVGVAENAITSEIGENPEPAAYFPFEQPLGPRAMVESAHLFVRTTDDPELLLPLLAGELRNADASAPVYDVRTFTDAIRGLVMPQQMGVVLLGSFATLTLVLASVGIYGVASYGAALRRREIGIRIALGSGRRAIGRLIVRQAAVPVAGGMITGVGLALFAGRLAAAFLFDVSPHDPVTLIAVALLLGLVALGAAYLPARRASRTDPMAALRAD